MLYFNPKPAGKDFEAGEARRNKGPRGVGDRSSVFKSRAGYRLDTHHVITPCIATLAGDASNDNEDARREGDETKNDNAACESLLAAAAAKRAITLQGAQQVFAILRGAKLIENRAWRLPV